VLKDMFRDVGATGTWKWQDVLRNIKMDERYKYINMPMQERKQIFADYLNDVKQEDRANQQLKKQRQRELFLALLDECQETGFVKFSVKSKYFQVSRKIAQKDYQKFMAVDERDRDEIFQDYIDDLLKE